MLPFRLAIRFIFSRKSNSIVNLIAAVGVIALMLTVAATLFTLSLQNGLEKFVESMYTSIDPALRVVKADGSLLDRHLLDDRGVGTVSARRDLNVLLECNGHQQAAVLSGVDSSFCSVTGIDALMSSGRNPIRENSYGILLGRGIAYELGIASGAIRPVRVSSVRKHRGLFSNVPLVRSVELLPVGIYSLDQDTDAEYAFAPLDRVDMLTSDSVSASSLEVSPAEGISKTELQQMLGSEYKVQDSSDIRSALYSMIGKEKWIIFALLMLIAVLASLSLAGTISVTRREKDEDIMILGYLGYTPKSVKKTFFLLGLMLTSFSVLMGAVLGYVLTAVQDGLGILTLGGSTFLIDSYPVSVDPLTWAAVLLSSVLAGALVSLAAAVKN